MDRIQNGRKGVVLLMLALGAPFFFGLAGLSVDTIYIYAVKARLVTAVDACALAAARSIGKGQTEMNRIVDMIFDSNFPSDMLMTISRSHTTPTITNVPGEGRREVSLSGTAVVPTLFMRIFGWDTLTLTASAEAARRDVNIMLILDRSGSMVLAPGPPWPQLQEAGKFFVNQFDTTADRMGLVTFGTTAGMTGGGAAIDYPINYAPGQDFKTGINNLIDTHQSYSGNRTNPSQALYLAYRDLVALNDTTALNAIVFFTDGQPTAFGNFFDVDTCPGDPCSNNNPIYGVVYTGQTLDNIAGLAHPLASVIPANEGGGGDDIRRYPGTSGSMSDVEQLLAPTALNGLRHYRPEGPNAQPEFRLDQGPENVDMSGNTLVNGSSAQRGKEVSDLAVNASIAIAQAARDVGTLNGGIRIYGIGLGGYLGAADHDFMKALANTEDSNPSYVPYDPSQPTGIYYYAPGPSQLRQAFQTVASEIFRLIQ